MASQESQISPNISSNPSVGSAGLLAIKFSNQPFHLVHVSWKYSLQFPPNTGNTFSSQSPKLNLSWIFFLNEQIFVGFSIIFKHLIHVMIIKAKLCQRNERSNSSLKVTGSSSFEVLAMIQLHVNKSALLEV